jgi:hypothetical protein
MKERFWQSTTFSQKITLKTPKLELLREQIIQNGNGWMGQGYMIFCL